MIRFVICVGVVSLVACGDPPHRLVDAPSMIPRTIAGTYSIESVLDFAMPEAARPAVLAIESATDGPDDPSRFVVDAMIATLPDGPVAHVAAAAAPFIAAYLNSRLAAIAPKLAPGLAQLGAGLARLAQHLDLIETLQIAADGSMTRIVTGVRFATGGPVVTLAEVGLPELAATAKLELRGGTLEVPAHTLAIPLTRLLRVGLDRFVVPAVDAHATDLAMALTELAQCPQLGAAVADELGIGSAALYATACGTAMTVIAADVDARIAAIGYAPLPLVVSGTALGLDTNEDGALDTIRDGAWIGQPGSAFAIVGGTFAGSR